MMDQRAPDPPELRRPNPWHGAVIVKIKVISGGSPLAFFDVHAPLLEATIIGCTLWRTRAGRLWCSPPKQRRQLPDGTTQYDDVIEWDGGAPASRFSASCLEAIQRHSPELLAPMIEGQGASVPLALPRQQRDTTPPDWWDR